MRKLIFFVMIGVLLVSTTSAFNFEDVVEKTRPESEVELDLENQPAQAVPKKKTVSNLPLFLKPQLELRADHSTNKRLATSIRGVLQRR